METITVTSENMNCQPLVTKDEWIEFLTDENFMSKNYKYALSIFYLEPEHKATCKHLGEKYHFSPSSLSGFITQFSSRVESRLNRFKIQKEDGTPNCWLITMTGEYLKNRLFEWKIRPELVQAIQELNYIEKNTVTIDSLGSLIQHINKDLHDFVDNKFRKSRKVLAKSGRKTTAGILFKYNDPDRDWAINEGGGIEIQFHTFFRGDTIGYGLGFNTKYVPFKNDKTPVEYMQPFANAFLSLQEDKEVEILNDRKFKLNTDIANLGSLEYDNYYLYGREVKLVDNKLSLIEYYNIINDLKGDVFELYKKIYETANELIIQEESDNMTNEDKPSELVSELIELLETNKNIILTGAPGTGKTYIAKQIIKAMDAESEFVQFHPSYDYTDFVEGLRPVQDDNGTLGFELRDGVFKTFCKKAYKSQNNNKTSNFEEVYENFMNDGIESELVLHTPSRKKPFRLEFNSQKSCVAIPDTKQQTRMTIKKDYIKTYLETGQVVDWKPYTLAIGSHLKEKYEFKVFDKHNENKKFVIILDEINRAEISKVFGELFFSIDAGYRGHQGDLNVTTQYANLHTEDDVFKDGFYIPDNVYIIGTMNDIDRSVESFDFAMRRRFAWKEIKAEKRLDMWDGNIDEFKEEAELRLKSLNMAIENVQGLNSSYHVGPSYFLKLEHYDGDFEKLWKNHLQSLLFEYLRGYPDATEQLKELKQAYDKSDNEQSDNAQTVDKDTEHEHTEND